MISKLAAVARERAIANELMLVGLHALAEVRPDIERWRAVGLDGRPGDSMALEVMLGRLLEVLHHFERR